MIPYDTRARLKREWYLNLGLNSPPGVLHEGWIGKRREPDRDIWPDSKESYDFTYQFSGTVHRMAGEHTTCVLESEVELIES